MEMGTAEGNAHQLSTAENAHELDAPDKLHEMGDLAPEYGAEGDIHVEGDIGEPTLEAKATKAISILKGTTESTRTRKALLYMGKVTRNVGAPQSP